jgi:hypothetical protein
MTWGITDSATPTPVFPRGEDLSRAESGKYALSLDFMTCHATIGHHSSLSPPNPLAVLVEYIHLSIIALYTLPETND